jgi:hypothetical protein
MEASAVFKPKTDQEFSRWVSEHPQGFVLNVRDNADPRFMVLLECAPSAGQADC